jgi:hypothetical protein
MHCHRPLKLTSCAEAADAIMVVNIAIAVSTLFIALLLFAQSLPLIARRVLDANQHRSRFLAIADLTQLELIWINDKARRLFMVSL